MGTPPAHPTFSCVVIGEQSLLIQCTELLLARGHRVTAVVAADPRIGTWCRERELVQLSAFDELAGRNAGSYDYLFSITNLRLLPDWLLAQPARLAINFHDGPLPERAGLNVPVWALLDGAPEHGITWHQMERGADTGDVLVERRFPVGGDDTAFDLNARCYEAGLDAFTELVEHLEQGTLAPRAQDLSCRRLFARDERPAGLAVLRWSAPAAALERVVRALDHGPYPNPMVLPSLVCGEHALLVRRAEVVASPGTDAAPGTVLAADATSVTVACGTGALRCTRLTDHRGEDVDVARWLAACGVASGGRLPVVGDAEASAWARQGAAAVRNERFWREELRRSEAVELPFGTTHEARNDGGGSVWAVRSVHAPADPAVAPVRAGDLIALWTLLLSRLNDRESLTFGYVPAPCAANGASASPLLARVVPLSATVPRTASFANVLAHVAERVAAVETNGTYLADLPARDPGAGSAADPARIPVRIVRAGVCDETVARRCGGGAALTVVIPDDGATIGFLADTTQVSPAELSLLAACLDTLLDARAHAAGDPVGTWPLVRVDDWLLQCEGVALGDGAGEAGDTVHAAFEAQVRRTPDHIACICGDERVSYDALNRRANRLAHYLRQQGVGAGDRVGVLVGRSIDMLVALHAVHKAGGAYVPLDPTYPADRLAYMVEDAGVRCLVSERGIAGVGDGVPEVVLAHIAAELEQQSPLDPAPLAAPADLAYVIYTSGSTGRPKGVMIEHRQVLNFYAGMDERLGVDPGVWLAVTSISFDISVLELFWTLARGYTVVLHGEHRGTAAPVSDAPARPLDFGLFYWNVATEHDTAADKYRLLTESARFGDQHGFNAVWTPERHFESFGGLYPNPSVTSAALAMITNRVALRAGSCVVPLHSPIRIAEEWAVVDNLSGGRVGISIAAGWAAPDFAIRPESFANAKRVMFESAEIVRKLWRGESVPFPGPNGEVQVRTLPRPLQPELPIWVTTAGNVETFVQAGTLGANILTHLLGQTVEEVAEKVRAYRAAWRAAGHAGEGIVTLMLHTFVGTDADAVEREVRAPFKAYLRSAMALVKAAAWQFPTFQRMSAEQGATLDEYFKTASEEEMDDLLEFAFQRYIRTSGLIGTPESCQAMVARARRAGVDEIACLIDFGIPTDTVLAHLPHLDTLRLAAQEALAQETPAPAAGVAPHEESLPELFARHQVTHFQCTPSMARMLMADPAGREGVSRLRHMMVGGEAFPPDLAAALRRTVGGRLTNMYGPTETTIWSAIGDVDGAGAHGSVPVGMPLPGQRVYVLDRHQQPLPHGVVGELVIGGAGVGRGYWNRAELTAERFLHDPFAANGDGRMYRTGDLGRVLSDGRIECLGRLDHQVKIRGYRIELGEIEALLRQETEVRDAVVVLREDVPGDQRLVAYIATASRDAVAAGPLRDRLRKHLPEFMVPSGIVPLAELPLTPNGKIDRKALPAPTAARAPVAASTPRSGSEALVSAIWQRVLGAEAIGTRENFFDIGGHSLLVVQVLAELRRQVSVPVQLTDLFRHTTIEALARFLDAGEAPAQGVARGQARADARRAARARRG